MDSKNKRALVISGGGCKGAFAGGFLEHVIHNEKISYDILLGTSTGSLLIPHIAIGKIEKIKHLYTSIRMDDIYNTNPFKIKKNKDGTIESSLSHINSLRRFLKGKKTFGESIKLKRLISECFTEDDYNIAKNTGKQVIATVANLSIGHMEYKFLHDCTYQDYVDWMWASTSFVPFMSLVKKNGYEYADGGFGNYLPIEEAVNLGANVIDAIILVPKTHSYTKTPESKNVFEVFVNTIKFMLKHIAKHDLTIGYLESIYNKDVKVNFYFTPYELTKYSFYFDPIQMSDWWDDGYHYAKQVFKP